MRRAVVVTAVVLLVATLVELVVLTLAERRTSTALCDLDVDLRPPVLLRVLADRDVPFTVSADSGDLDRLVPRPDAVTGLRVADGRVFLETSARMEVPADVRLDHGSVLVSPKVGPFGLDRLALRVPLVDLLPTGVDLHAVEVRGDVVRARGDVDVRQLTPTGIAMRCAPQLSVGSSG